MMEDMSIISPKADLLAEYNKLQVKINRIAYQISLQTEVGQTERLTKLLNYYQAEAEEYEDIIMDNWDVL